MGKSSTTFTRKRSRLVAGCASCRARHQKCDLNLPKCHQCQIHGIVCDREIKLRFRHESFAGVSFKDAFPADQRWLNIINTIEFYDETPDIQRFYDHVSLEQDAPSGTILNGIHGGPTLYDVESATHSHINQLSEPRGRGSHGRTDAGSKRVAPGLLNETTSLPATAYAPTTSSIRGQVLDAFGSTQSPPTLPSYSSNAHSTPREEQFHPFTGREAELMRNFTENMALWADVTDVERHFEIEVPRRALSNTMLRYAIFSFSSRHLHRHIHEFDSEEAITYRNKALQQLIPQLSGPIEALNEEHLAAVVILRLDEEMDVEDIQSHLSGATNILNSISTFSSSGGLGEACAWLCLRQDIHVSIDTQTPLRTNLENFHNSLWLRKDDDMSWTNKMVLLLARLLGQAFQDRTTETNMNIKKLSKQIEEWEQVKPLSFRPIRFTARGKQKGQRLPVIWLLSSFHVLGMQCYHISKIVLLLSVSPDVELSVGLSDYQQSRKIEKSIRKHLLTILGLAVSNPRAENTLFQARHALVGWGGVLRHELDQDAAKDFLITMRERTGWNISRDLQTLSKLWQDDSD